MSNLTLSNLIYLLINALMYFAKYKFIHVFFSDSKISKITELFCYALAFAINSSLFLLFDNEILNLFSTVSLIFLLTMIYKSTFLKKSIATLIICGTRLFTESVVYYTVLYFQLDHYLTVVISWIISGIMTYFFVLLFYNFKNMKENHKISRTYMVVVFSVSLSSIYISIILMLMYDYIGNSSISIVPGIAALLALNVFVVYLFDTMNKYYQKEEKNKLLEQQNKFYIRQLETINESNRNFKILRHDMEKHLIILNSFSEINDIHSIKKEITKMLNYTISATEYSKSGNIVMDSILNYKLSEAENKNIKVELELKIPDYLNIESSDIAIILGNLLDNAIEGASKVIGDKKIKVLIYFEKGILCVNITNTFNGELIFEDTKYKTTNKNKNEHGLGLLSVSKILEKYQGGITISHTKNLFCVKILMQNNII